MMAEFEAIVEDPEEFNAFVNAAEAGVKVARAKQKSCVWERGNGPGPILLLRQASSLVKVLLLMAIESEPTVLPSIFLSDLSIVEHGTQKRSLVGCFDKFTFPLFPANYPGFSSQFGLQILKAR